MIALLAALLVAAPPPQDPTKLPLPKITDAMPFTRLLAQEMSGMPDGDLATYVDQMHSRLFLDDSTTVIEVASDLELALRYATAVQMLEARPMLAQGPQAAVLRYHARSAAYLLYATGHVYESREDVRASVDSFLPQPTAPNRQAVEAMIAAIRTMRYYGNHWFSQVIGPAKAEKPDDLGVIVQEGWWLEYEGKPLEAAERFTKALALKMTDAIALAAYDAFLQAGVPEADSAAETLRASIVKAYPMLATRFANTKDYSDAVRATARYEANIGNNDVDACVAQLPRYLRLDRPGAADLLAREVIGRFPKDAKAWHAAAETWFLLSRFESLRTLLVDAEANGLFDARLREIRIAARAKVLLQEALGAAHHPLADGDFDGDLAAFVKAGGGPGSNADLAAHATRVYLAVAKYIALSKQAGLPKNALPDQVKAAEATIDALLKARPKDPQAFVLAATAWAGLENPREALTRLTPLLPKLGAEANGVAFLLARIEAGIALRERDAALMKSALARFAKLDKAKSGFDRASFTLAYTTAKLGSQVLAGGPIDLASANEAKAKLDTLDGQFDESEIDGRTLAQAHELTRATVALVSSTLAPNPTMATAAADGFRAARAARRDGELALFAGGLIQWLAGDARGAYELYARAAALTDRPALTQALWFGQAQAAAQVGEAAIARAAAQKALDEWSSASLPEVMQMGTARPLFVGDFDLGLRIVAGEPMTVSLRANPVLVLVPELASSKAATQSFLEAIDAQKKP